jgi:sugar phosphate isomerase/epimerase
MTKNQKISLSTAWNYDGIISPGKALSEIKSIGFGAVEIGYNFTAAKLKEFILAARDMGMDVSSIHNFCPMPAEKVTGRHVSDSFRISSLDKIERRRAVDYTKRTVDTACEVSCKVVVVHAGAADIDRNMVNRLLDMYRNGTAEFKEYNELKDTILGLYKEKTKYHMDAIVKSLEEITAHAEPAGVKVGIENRYYPQEIPHIEDIAYLLDIFRNKGLVYWHDVGHGEVNERLGIAPHEDFLKRFSSCLAGVHIHGIRGIDDHLAPFTGDFELSKIIPYMRDDVIKVIEAHSEAAKDELIGARERLCYR